MKLMTEIADIGEAEILIRCNERTDKIKSIESMLEAFIQQGEDMVLSIGDTEYYISKKEILFLKRRKARLPLIH